MKSPRKERKNGRAKEESKDAASWWWLPDRTARGYAVGQTQRRKNEANGLSVFGAGETSLHAALNLN